MKHLHHLLLPLCFAFLAINMQAYDKIGISFTRSGTSASGVTVQLLDQDGKVIEGASASITCNQTLKEGGSITSAMLVPNVNGNTSPTITLGISITGLQESITFDEVGMDIHAFNGSGGYQANNDNVNRQWNVSLSSNDYNVCTLNDIDIAAGIANSHKFWAFTINDTAEGSLSLEMTITAGTENKGCFFGISDITIGGHERIEASTEPSIPADENHIFGGDDKYYYFTWRSDAASYMEESGGYLQVSGRDNSHKQYWQLIPTDNKECYYIKNVVTGNYIQSCNTTESISGQHFKIETGTKPQEFYICEGTSSLATYYRMTSTDCTNWATTSSSPYGLNKDGASSSIVIWNAGTSNVGSYWKIVETQFDYDYTAAAMALVHSEFAKASQIYFNPCANYQGMYQVRKLIVSGEGAVKELTYPCDTWTGAKKKLAANSLSTAAYELLTTDKGKVARGHEIEVSATFRKELLEGTICYFCFDWNHDGVFESIVSANNLEATQKVTVSVPEDAVLGESRMRIRITDNGLDGADEEATFQILDFIISTIEYEAPSLTIRVNDKHRGFVTKELVEGTDNVYTLKATAVGDAKFLYWGQEKRLLATTSELEVTVERPTTITAYFSVNTTDADPEGIQQITTTTDTTYATPMYFDLHGRRVTTLSRGCTYIKKTSDRNGEIFIKE